MGQCCIKGKKKQTNARDFGGGPIFLDNNNRESQNKHVHKEDPKSHKLDSSPIPIKKVKNITESEREQRRQQSITAAEKRHTEIDMKGMTKEAYEEFKQKQRKAMEYEKYTITTVQALQ